MRLLASSSALHRRCAGRECWLPVAQSGDISLIPLAQATARPSSTCF